MSVQLAAADTKRLGLLTRSEFSRALRKLDLDLDGADVEKLTAFFDPHREDVVSWRGVAQWIRLDLGSVTRKVRHRLGMLQRMGRDLKRIFRTIDRDRSGELDASEFGEAMAKLGLMLTDGEVRARERAEPRCESSRAEPSRAESRDEPSRAER